MAVAKAYASVEARLGSHVDTKAVLRIIVARRAEAFEENCKRGVSHFVVLRRVRVRGATSRFFQISLIYSAVRSYLWRYRAGFRITGHMTSKRAIFYRLGIAEDITAASGVWRPYFES